MIQSKRHPEEETTTLSCDECMLTVVISMLSPIYQEYVEWFMVLHSMCKDHEFVPDFERMSKIMKAMPGSPFKDLLKVRVQDPTL